MISIEDRTKILLATSQAFIEVEKEIQEDHCGFFNAKTSLNALREKTSLKLLDLFNEQIGPDSSGRWPFF